MHFSSIAAYALAAACTAYAEIPTGYTRTDVRHYGPYKPGGECVTIDAPFDQVKSKLLALNPKYDDEDWSGYRNGSIACPESESSSTEASVAPRQAESTEERVALGTAPFWKVTCEKDRFGYVDATASRKMIHDLPKEGATGTTARSCQRVGCAFGKYEIAWCNDNDRNKSLDWQDIWMRLGLTDFSCLRGNCWDGLSVSGQTFYDDGTNVLIQQTKC